MAQIAEALGLEDANSEEAKRIIVEDAVFNQGDLILDSLSFAAILLGCEETFDVEIPVEDATKLKRVGDLIDYLKDKVAKKSK